MATVPKQVTSLQTTVAPRLPVAPVEYDQRFIDEFIRILRLYFNQIDNLNAGMLSPTGGGGYLAFPFISAYYYPEQYATATNTATAVKWNATAHTLGFTLNLDNTATAGQSGWYKITYSLQLANSDNADHDAIVWLRVNGTDVANSTTIFTVPSRKSAGIFGYAAGVSEVEFFLNAGDKVGLFWGTDQAASSGGALGVWMYARAAQTTPMAYPETPSAIGSITFLSAD